MRDPIRGILRRLALLFRDVQATRAGVEELRAIVANQSALLAAMNEREAVLLESLDRPGALGSNASVLSELKRALDALQIIYDGEPGNRRRLYAARASSEYEAAYAEDEPLVSVIIPTYTSFETLRDRAIPSILAQTYANWEIVVVGDAAPPETEAVITSLADPRIRYENQPMRGPYPEGEYDAWLVSAVPPFNAGMRAARGRWIAPFADDDALRPLALEQLVETVRSHRHEFCYSKILLHGRQGKDEEIGAFPPHLSPTGISAGMQGSLLHSELRFFEQELADVIFRTPADWSMVRKMMRAGVRIGFLDEVTADYYPSYRGEDASGGSPLR